MFVDHASYIVCYLRPSVFQKQPLYLHEVGVMSAYILSSQIPPMRFHWHLNADGRHWCEMNCLSLLKTIAREAYQCNYEHAAYVAGIFEGDGEFPAIGIDKFNGLGSDSMQNLYQVNGTVIKRHRCNKVEAVEKKVASEGCML